MNATIIIISMFCIRLAGLSWVLVEIKLYLLWLCVRTRQLGCSNMETQAIILQITNYNKLYNSYILNRIWYFFLYFPLSRTLLQKNGNLCGTGTKRISWTFLTGTVGNNTFVLCINLLVFKKNAAFWSAEIGRFWLKIKTLM